MSPDTPSARDGVLKALQEEAARFSQPASAGTRSESPRPPRPAASSGRREPAAVVAPIRPPEPVADMSDPASSAGYVPVAVAPERGNTRPTVPVDGRLHLRGAQPTLDALDAVVAEWKSDNPERRDLERATLVRIGLAMVLADIREHGEEGAVGEAITAALDPAVRHMAVPMPPLERWITPPASSG